MAISRLSTSRLTQGLPSSYSAWDQDTAQGAIEPIGSTLCDGTTVTVAFDNIPQTYQDLMLVVNGRSSYTGTFTTYSVYLNLASFASTSYTNFVGDGTTASSGRASNGAYGASLYFPGSGSPAGYFTPSVTHILDYKSANNKLMISKYGTEVNSGGGYIGYQATLYKDTSALTRVAASTNDTFVAGTRVTLYGIRAGN